MLKTKCWVKLAEDKYVLWDTKLYMPSNFIVNREKVFKALQYESLYIDKCLGFVDGWSHVDMYSTEELKLIDDSYPIEMKKIISFNRAGRHNNTLDLEGLIKYYTDPEEDL